jgi:hypothetical protein
LPFIICTLILRDVIPELRIIRYNAAKDWLKAVAKGDISPDLPEKPDEGRRRGNRKPGDQNLKQPEIFRALLITL